MISENNIKKIIAELSFYRGYIMYLKVEDPYFNTAVNKYNDLLYKLKLMRDKNV